MFQCYTQTPIALYGVSILVLVVMFVYLLRFGTQSPTIGWFRTFLVTSMGYNLAAATLKCAQPGAAYTYIVDFYGLMATMMIPVLLIFVLHFINREQLLSRAWLRATIFLVTTTSMYIFWRTEGAVSHDISQTFFEFGFRAAIPGSLAGLIGVLDLGGYITPIVVTGIYYRHLQDPLKKREVRLVLIGLATLIAPSTLFEGILPGIFHTPSFPISPVTSVIACTLITYAIVKYGLRVFSLSNVTSDLMQVMPGGLIILDHTNTIQYINDGAAAMLGHSKGALSGMSIRKLFSGAAEYGAFQTNVIGKLGPHKQVAGYDMELYDKRKQLLPVSINAVNVYVGQELVNRLVSFTDISKLKRAEAELKKEKAGVERKVVERTRELSEAQARLAASLGGLPFGFAVVDPGDHIVFSNWALGTLLGRHIPSDTVGSAEALKRFSNDFKHSIDILGLLHECQKTEKLIEKDISFGPMFYHFLFVPIVSTQKGRKQSVGSVLIMEDVTEKKAMDRSRDEFFSIASHELRTPLTAIRGNSDMILTYYPEAVKEPSLKEMVTDMHESSIRLITVVNDFLDTSRLEQGKIQFKTGAFDMVQLIRDTLREYDVTGSRRKLSLVLADPPADLPMVFADRDRTRQVLINLIGNAIKFTKAGGVTITLTTDKRTLKVQVTDTGKGIPVEQQHLLFHKFQQAADSILTRDDTRGTGLGLYISRLLAEGMSGKLEMIESVVGKGTTFVLELPVTR